MSYRMKLREIKIKAGVGEPVPDNLKVVAVRVVQKLYRDIKFSLEGITNSDLEELIELAFKDEGCENCLIFSQIKKGEKEKPLSINAWPEMFQTTYIGRRKGSCVLRFFISNSLKRILIRYTRN